MRNALRVVVVLFVVPASYFFIFWVPFSFLPFREFRWIASIISLLCAIGIGRYTWKKLETTPDGLVSNVMLGAIVTGAIGFCGGFFGPLIFTPDANQGPLLGIFITGPLGFILGGIGGLVYRLVKSRKTAADG